MIIAPTHPGPIFDQRGIATQLLYLIHSRECRDLVDNETTMCTYTVLDFDLIQPC